MQQQDVGQSTYQPASTKIGSTATTHQEHSALPGQNFHHATTHHVCGELALSNHWDIDSEVKIPVIIS
ncbi:hypothetical protein V5799_015805 [Amblyomma americanum]|uniref:Uncharacterized protein n=1 Tax=Amblyomma americanum TaxID=6943 RepID=A0AAQ4F6X6_AMBAM